MSITVLDPVPLTTVQDAGRVGYAAQGYRSCGCLLYTSDAADELASV